VQSCTVCAVVITEILTLLPGRSSLIDKNATSVTRFATTVGHADGAYEQCNIFIRVYTSDFNQYVTDLSVSRPTYPPVQLVDPQDSTE